MGLRHPAEVLGNRSCVYALLNGRALIPARAAAVLPPVPERRGHGQAWRLGPGRHWGQAWGASRPMADAIVCDLRTPRTQRRHTRPRRARSPLCPRLLCAETRLLSALSRRVASAGPLSCVPPLYRVVLVVTCALREIRSYLLVVRLSRGLRNASGVRLCAVYKKNPA